MRLQKRSPAVGGYCLRGQIGWKASPLSEVQLAPTLCAKGIGAARCRRWAKASQRGRCTPFCPREKIRHHFAVSRLGANLSQPIAPRGSGRMTTLHKPQPSTIFYNGSNSS